MRHYNLYSCHTDAYTLSGKGIATINYYIMKFGEFRES